MDLKQIKDLERYPKKVFEKGDYLIYQGQPLHHLLVLLEGNVQRKQTIETGEDIVYDVRKGNNQTDSLLGVLILFSTNQTATTSFVAKDRCTVLMIPDTDFFRYAATHPELLIELLRHSMSRYDYLDAQYRIRLEKKTANKLCAMMLQFAKDNQVVLPMSLSDIARFYGVHRVTISKIIKKLENLQVIRREKNYIQILNISELKAYADGKKISYNSL